MATHPVEYATNDSHFGNLLPDGSDATTAFEPGDNPFHPAANASSESLMVAPRTPALDEEDEIEDDPDEDDDEDEDEDDDDLEDDEDEDDVLDDEDDDLEDEDEEDDDEDDEEEEEEEDE